MLRACIAAKDRLGMPLLSGTYGGGAGNRTRVRVTSNARVYARSVRSISGRPVANAGEANPLACFDLARRWRPASGRGPAS